MSLRRESPEQIYVRAHYRDRGVAQPHWIALRVDGKNYSFLVSYAENSEVEDWSPYASQAMVFLKNPLKTRFKERIQQGKIILYRVD